MSGSGGGGNRVRGAGDGFDADGGESRRGVAGRAEGIVVEGGEDFLIRPVQKGFALALEAEGVTVIGIIAREEEGEGDAGEEGEDDYDRDKCSHGDSPFYLDVRRSTVGLLRDSASEMA